MPNRLTYSVSVLFIFICATANGTETQPRLYWPTANSAYLEGGAPESYLQATGSGRIASGDWGCTRNRGSRFHEGIDLKSVNWTSDGKADDFVFAASGGTIAHVSQDTLDSNYGKYIVISHIEQGLEWYSLYAHLRTIREDIKPGKRIKAGTALGLIGNTSSSIEIPLQRSHLHFEIGVRTSSYFDTWFLQQNYETPNRHGSWNGINLIGANPLEFYNYTRSNPELPFASFFLEESISFEILVYFDNPPDFLIRNPVFLNSSNKRVKAGWYSIGFSWYGLPSRWKHLDDRKIDRRLAKESIHVRMFKHEKPCRNYVDEKDGEFVATTLLEHLVARLKATR
jgi:murein DD-endopeptidase MepM/ murein hydrolase activator NlpD